jgi:hypothetical protein
MKFRINGSCLFEFSWKGFRNSVKRLDDKSSKSSETEQDYSVPQKILAFVSSHEDSAVIPGAFTYSGYCTWEDPWTVKTFNTRGKKYKSSLKWKERSGYRSVTSEEKKNFRQ